MSVNAVLHNDLEQTARFARMFGRLKVWDQALLIAQMRAEARDPAEVPVSDSLALPAARAGRTWSATDCVSASAGIEVQVRTVPVRLIGSPPPPPALGPSAEELARKYARELAVFCGAFGFAEQPAPANRDRLKGEGAVATPQPTAVVGVKAQTASAAKRFDDTLEWLHRAYNEGGQGTC